LPFFFFFGVVFFVGRPSAAAASRCFPSGRSLAGRPVRPKRPAGELCSPQQCLAHEQRAARAFTRTPTLHNPRSPTGNRTKRSNCTQQAYARGLERCAVVVLSTTDHLDSSIPRPVLSCWLVATQGAKAWRGSRCNSAMRNFDEELSAGLDEEAFALARCMALLLRATAAEA